MPTESVENGILYRAWLRQSKWTESRSILYCTCCSSSRGRSRTTEIGRTPAIVA